jgi:hypothetical protein
MPRIDILDLGIADGTMDKLWRHGITDNQLYAVLDHFWIVVRNRKDRAATHVLIGTDDHDRCLTIPIVATDDPVIWQPITAWHCKPSGAAILRKRRSS